MRHKNLISPFFLFALFLTACVNESPALLTIEPTTSPPTPTIFQEKNFEFSQYLYSTPTPITPGEIIHPHNAMDITLLHRLGSGTLEGFTLHPNGEILAAVGGRGVWLYETLDLSIFDHLDGEFTYSAAWSPDGNFLAVREDERIIVWDLASRQIFRVLNTNYGMGNNIIWSPDESMIASGDIEGVISVWGLASGNLIRQMWYEEEINLGTISWSPDKRQIASAIQYKDSETSGVAIWDIYQRKLIRELRGQEGRITCLSWSPVNHFLATGNEDGSVWIWEPASRQVVTILQGYEDSSTITDLAWSVDGTQIVAAGENGTLTTWKVASKEFTHLTIEEGSTILQIS